MTLTKRGNFWHSRFKFRGQEYSQSTKLTSHRDAVAWEAQFKARLALGEVGLAPAPLMSVAWRNWADNAKGRVGQADLNRATRAWKHHLEPVLANLRADQVTDDIVAMVRTKYMEGPSKRTHGGGKARTPRGANTVMETLKRILRPLVRQGILRRLPVIPMPRPQAPVKPWVRKDAIRALFAAVDRTGNLHQSVAVRAMYYLLLREAEALGMKWQWFGDRLNWYTPGKTKGKEAIPLPVHRELRVFLHALTWGVPQAFGYCIPAEDGRPHRAQFTVKAIRRGGLRGITPHSLRRSGATQMHADGVPLKTIQQFLRHVDLETTAIYIQVGGADLEAAIERTWGVQKSHRAKSKPA